jgi:hypothetical protein
MEERSDRFTAIEDQYAGYMVYDQHYEKMGNVDDLFLDENDSPEYLGVKMGFLGTRTTLIPFEMARVNDARQLIEVAADKETVKNGPTFDDDREITPEFENEVYTPTTASGALPLSRRAAPTGPTMPSRAPRRRVWPIAPT